jgi:broad specificity phosphatase PhoE
MTQPISNDPSFFVVIRHMDKQEGPDPALTPYGVAQAEIAGPALQAFIASKLGQRTIAFIASTLKRSQETAERMAQFAAISEPIIIDARIREREHGEPEAARGARIAEGIIEYLKHADGKTIPIFVSHGLIVNSYLKKLMAEGHVIPPDLKEHHLKTGEALFFKKEGDKITLLARLRPDFPPSQTVPAAKL